MALRVLHRGQCSTLRLWEFASRGEPIPARGSAAHATLELAWTARGSVQYAIGAHRIELGPTTLIVLRPHVEHETELRAGISARSLHLDGDWPRVLHCVPQVVRDLDRQGFAVLKATSGAQAVLRAAATSDSDLLSGHSVASRVFEELALSPLQTGASANWRVVRAIEHIHANPFDGLTVDALARVAGVSKFHFAREFRAATGQSPHQYLLNVRLALSALYLRTGCDVTASARQSGFTDLSRFARMFCRRYGARPSAFRVSDSDYSRSAVAKIAAMSLASTCRSPSRS